MHDAKWVTCSLHSLMIDEEQIKTVHANMAWMLML
jgi:hypothetical protein